GSFGSQISAGRSSGGRGRSRIDLTAATCAPIDFTSCSRSAGVYSTPASFSASRIVSVVMSLEAGSADPANGSGRAGGKTDAPIAIASTSLRLTDTARHLEWGSREATRAVSHRNRKNRDRRLLILRLRVHSLEVERTAATAHFRLDDELAAVLVHFVGFAGLAHRRLALHRELLLLELGLDLGDVTIERRVLDFG